MGANRLLSVIGVFSGFMAVLFYLIFGLVPMVSRQLAAIVRDLPSYIAMAQEWVAQLPERYPQLVASSTDDAIADATMDHLESMAEQAPQELAVISQDQLSRLLDDVGSELGSSGE